MKLVVLPSTLRVVSPCRLSSTDDFVGMLGVLQYSEEYQLTDLHAGMLVQSLPSQHL